MIPGETVASGAPVTCGKEPCGATGPMVTRSAAGWYVGYYCARCGPYSRESIYYKTAEEASDALNAGTYAR
jgi:hypothetical protein